MAETEQYRRVGKFELHEPIGEGAMGEVWRAYDSVIRRYVALKLLSRAGRSADARERLLREARAAGALQHPNIVTIYDLGEADGQLFIAMELVDGRDLSTLIALREPLPLERKLDLVIEVLQGLSYAHERGVIHRDIKPSNVRIASDGSVKIMDFGIALQSADVTGSGAIVGTPTYMAPEQITNGAITPATDVFAVGCLLYELLTYRKPFEGETVHGVLYQVLTTDPKPLRTTVPSIPAALERVVSKALIKVPEERYETARQMQSALFAIRAALSGASDTTQRLSLRWSPIPSAVLRLVTHAPVKWRAAVLTTLMVTALVLLYVSRSPSPVAAPIGDAQFAGASLDQVLGYALPATLNGALVAQRDSTLAARERARRAGAMKNNVPSLILAETVLLTAEGALRSGDLARAASGYVSAIPQYRKAQQEAEALRREAQLALARATPVVNALGSTRPEAGRAGASLGRAESLYATGDWVVARLAAQDAEQVGVAAGVAPPSPQPAETRAAVGVLLQDLERAMASERVSNLQVLMPGMAANDVTAWETFFQRYTRLTARYAVERLSARGDTASALVRTSYAFVPAGGGAQRETRLRQAIRFLKTPDGWRIANIRDAP